MPLECHRAGLIFGGEIFPGSHVVGGGRLFGRRSGGSSAGGGPDQPDADGQLDFLPILASLVDKANPGDLYQKFQLLILACSAGTLAAWLLLPNPVSLYCHLVEGAPKAAWLARNFS